MGNSPNFAQIRKTKITARNNQLAEYIPKFDKILNDNNISQKDVDRITRSNMVELVHLLNERKITSLVLVAVYGRRAATIGERLCIITEDYFQYALKAATDCDHVRKTSGLKNWTFGDQWNLKSFLPPLFGIPMSIKENIEMEGTCSAIGLTIRANDIKKEDTAIIKCFKNSGMIPLHKTNLPQCAMTFESHSFLWGRSLNPWNQKRATGGSSGGEGASLAARLSPIGVGNDIGGSLRIPAEFGGTCALLSSQQRLSTSTCTKYTSSFSGMDSIKVVTGPMSTSVDALALHMKVFCAEQFYGGQHDAYNKLFPFDEKVYKEYQNKSNLKIGYIRSLDFIQCTVASQRAVDQTLNILKSKGYTLEEIAIPNEREVISAFFVELSGEGGLKAFHQMAEGQDLIPEYKNFDKITNMNGFLKGCVEGIFNKTQPRLGYLVSKTGEVSCHEYLNNAGRILELKSEWVKYYRSKKLDFIIAPGFGCQAIAHGLSNDASLAGAYTYIWNILAMTTGALPITVVREDEQHYESKWDDDITAVLQQNAKETIGLPVGIQVVSLPFAEEKVLGLMKLIENQVKFYSKHPLPVIEK